MRTVQIKLCIKDIGAQVCTITQGGFFYAAKTILDKDFKGCFVFTIVGGVVTAIWLSVASGGIMWWIAPLGIAITLFSAAAIGTLVEISENIAMRIDDEESEYPTVPSEIEEDFSFDDGSVSLEDIQKKAVDYAPKQIRSAAGKKDQWLCPDCGMANDFCVTACRKCGWQA